MDDFIFLQANKPMWPASANVFAIKDDDGFTLIDVGCGLRKFTKKFFMKLEENNIKLQEIHSILLTHAHPDHMGAMSKILEKINPLILINEIEKNSALNIDLLNVSFNTNLMKNYLKNELNNAFSLDINEHFKFVCSMSQLPEDSEIKTIKNNDILNLGNYKFKVLTTPGHAPGHTSLYEINQEFLLSGDIIAEKGVTWYSPSSGGVVGLLKSFEKIDKLNVKFIYPSHGNRFEKVSLRIQEIRNKLLQRENIILEKLEKGSQKLSYFVELFFPNNIFKMIGLVIVESHLEKLQNEEKIKRKNGLIMKV